MQIFIRGAAIGSQKTIILDVESEASIGEIKDMISIKIGLSKCDFGLVFGGFILTNDSSSLSENRIGMECTICVFTRSYGD